MVTTSVRSCLFGGALMAAGMAHAQPTFQWVDVIGSYETAAYAFDDLTGSYSYGYGDIQTLSYIFENAGATVSLEDTSAVCDVFTIGGDFSTGDATAAVEFSVTEPATVRATWNIVDGGSLAVAVFVLADLDNQQILFNQFNEGNSGTRDIQLEPGVFYALDLNAIAFGPNSTVSLGLEIIDDAARLCADANNNGAVEPTDFSAWVAAFNANDPVADVNQNGSVEPTDFSAWVAAFNLGAAGPTCTP